MLAALLFVVIHWLIAVKGFQFIILFIIILITVLFRLLHPTLAMLAEVTAQLQFSQLATSGERLELVSPVSSTLPLSLSLSVQPGD